MKNKITENEIYLRNVPKTTEILNKKTVAIAGCGGLGSNIAIALARSGVGNMILVDFDTVEVSNLNRQYYFQSDVGELKVLALANHIKAINPKINLVVYIQKLKGKDVTKLFSAADLMIEAFDKAESKKWLIDTWCKNYPEKPIICGSGMSGLGNTDKLKVVRAGNLFICGDQFSEMSEGLSAPRVAIVANMQANEALELLTKKYLYNV